VGSLVTTEQTCRMPPDSSRLPDGLRLRAARPADLDQIGSLLVDRGEAGDDVDHRLVVQDTAAGWETSGVVVDGDRVVATATLLDETVRVGEVTMPAGQVELVATAEEYEGRGLMRALMGWAHDLSAARGHLLQVMIGIPYVYRRFGYEYAIDLPPAREVRDLPAPAAPAPAAPAPAAPAPTTGPGHGPHRDPYALRPARDEDAAALAALQAQAQAPYDVAVPHPEARWRWLLETPASALWVLAREVEGGEEVVASVRLRDDDDGVLLADAAARDDDAAEALLRAVVRLRPGRRLSVVDRALTAPARRWADRLGPADELAEQYYGRVPRLAPVLDVMRPVLTARMAGAGLDRAGTEIVLSTFGEHVRVPVDDDGVLGAPRTGGRLQWPASVGGAGVAPDQLGGLLLGAGMHTLARRRPDVYPGPDAELFDALFPAVTADVLSYYLPW
jgi:predicted N-acetyltransferase YhbS